MATAGTVTIRLDGDSATLIRELNKANKATKKTGSKMGANLKKIGRGAAIMGAAFAAVTVIMVKNSLAVNDALAKTADQLGIATEALAGLRFGANIAGVASASLDKALRKQQKAIVDGTRGLTTYTKAFDSIGLNAENLINLSVDEQFFKIGAAINSVGNQATKTAAAYDIFGGKNVALLNLFAQGEEAMRAFSAEAVALGIALNRTDAAKIEQANDAILRAKSAVEGLSNKLTVALAPILEVVANEFVEFVKTVGTGSSSLIDLSAGVVKGFIFIGDAIKGVKILFLGTLLAIETAFVSFYGLFIGAAAGVAGALSDVLLKVEVAAHASQSAIQGGVTSLASNAASIVGTVGDVLDSLLGKIQGVAEATAETVRGGLVTLVQIVPNIAIKISAALDKVLANIQSVAGALANIPGLESFSKGIVSGISEARESLAGFTDAAQELKDNLAAGLGEGLGQGIADGIGDARESLNSFTASAQERAQGLAGSFVGFGDGIVSGLDSGRIAMSRFSDSATLFNDALIDGQRQSQQVVANLGQSLGVNAGYVDEFTAKLQAAAAAAASVSLPKVEDVEGVDLSGTAAAQIELQELLLEQERKRADIRLGIEAELLEAQFLGAEALTARKQELAAGLAEFEAVAEIEKQEAINQAKGVDGDLSEEDRAAIRTQVAVSAAKAIATANQKAASDVTKAWSGELKKTKSAHAQTWSSALKSFQSFAGGSSKISKAMFAANKAYGIAEAIVNTWQGVTKALTLPYPANIAAAAQTLSVGLGAVASIQGATPGGGGGGSVSGGGSISDAGVAVDNAIVEGDTEQEGGQSVVQVIIQGNLIGQDEYVTAHLIPAFQDAVKDRDIVLIDADSRNGQELQGTLA